MYLVIAGTILMSCGKSEEKKEGEAQTTETASDTATYKIDAGASSIKWVGKKVTGQHNGKINIQGGDVTASGSTVIGGNVIIDMASITNEDLTDKKANSDLIGHLKSPDFFSTDSFPTANFVIKSVKPEGDKQTVVGDLTIKGITQEISFPVEVKADSNSLKATGKATLDRTKWNIRYGSGKFFQGLGDKMIYDEIELDVDVKATK